jgi:AbrB family looped-hinge helix DNA binding protein
MTSARTKLGPGGRIVIPATQPKALGLKDGDELLLRIEDDELRIVGRDRAQRRLQEAVARRNRSGVLLSERLIAERRAEAAREPEGA